MNGTPEKGTFTADFSRLSLSATQSTQVGMGNAIINDKVYYVGSVVHNGIEHQGIINNDIHKITIKIPYTSGRGSYSGFTATQISAVGQGGRRKYVDTYDSSWNLQ